ncbi:riboflavin kinase/FMN adenylyltransferase [Rubidibacter lacunae KORDI 51-2]|uniref:Riboflavin biosynthesis protein n=1 Tax=Rubidibacter lacunae KORDI 51-2 TaxID=582515 RepID=U5DHC5_9CHRO|nr:bifunctional riboflavin kinase/FAD synthetase [Rubidibacter lacunae]ERN41011.1 riboflavin kinase/FMN adenylyltransferase [Rubidibacter lacunae KORDI 51-2]
MHIASTTADILAPTALALGNFDGVHRGHQQVIRPVLAAADGMAARPTVVTFDPHPREFFSGERRLALTPLPEKAAYLNAIGIEQLVALRFDAALAALDPQTFVREVLVAQLQARFVSIGRDFCFGQQRAGTAEDLKAIATPDGIEVAIAGLELDGEARISSSRIRAALSEGKVATARQWLGRPYALCGTVVVGAQLGRKLGFPTANLQMPPNKFLPCHGVYYVRVTIGGAVGNDGRSSAASLGGATQRMNDANPILPGVMNLGVRPTVDGRQLRAEVHLLDWSGDLYGRAISVELLEFLRSERSFSSLDALKTQIAADCDAARRLASR